VDEGALTALLGRHASRHAVPGAAIGILREGAIATAFHGVADARSGEPVGGETRFSVGSLTKSMVATAVARLAEAGRLSLDDPVCWHVPELRTVGWAERATVRDLLANRSGLPLRAEQREPACPLACDGMQTDQVDHLVDPPSGQLLRLREHEQVVVRGATGVHRLGLQQRPDRTQGSGSSR
jgi:CubicO group peptidase (beta-lactamase class C family)